MKLVGIELDWSLTKVKQIKMNIRNNFLKRGEGPAPPLLPKPSGFFLALFHV